MNKKLIRIFFVGIVVVQFAFFLMSFMLFENLNSARDDLPIYMRGAKVCVIIADGYSHEDLTSTLTYLEQWRCTIEIAGTHKNVTSEEDFSVVSDILTQEIVNITYYHGIFIPGGTHYQNLIADEQIIQLFNNANNFNLVIAGIGKGILVQASAGVLNGKRVTNIVDISDNLTSSGGVLVEGLNVVTDGNIITAKPHNYEEFSYALANAMGYSYQIEAKISFEKIPEGWNYSINIEISDKNVISAIEMNLSILLDDNEKSLIKTIELKKQEAGIYFGTLGILANEEYVVDIKTVSIYGKIEIRNNVAEFSVGSN